MELTILVLFRSNIRFGVFDHKHLFFAGFTYLFGVTHIAFHPSW